MNIQASDTESVVQNHLRAFVEKKGIDAILRDYDDDARFLSEIRTYHGKREIRHFFEAFIASLPPDAINRFSLRTLRVEGDIAYITWGVGDAVPLGTDTFVVRNGKIVSQTFAMQPPAAA
jgi:ketosteroid isomerase-like protein